VFGRSNKGVTQKARESLHKLELFDETILDYPMLDKLMNLAKLATITLRSLEEKSGIIPSPGMSLGLGGRTKWADLDDVGLELQRDAWAYFDRLLSLGSFVLAADVPSRKGRFDELASDVRFVLLQRNSDRFLGARGPEATDFGGARDAIKEQVQLLMQASPPTRACPIFVPDTNALLDISAKATGASQGPLDWARLIAAHRKAVVVIVLPVVKELDVLKHSRDKRRAELAQAAISVLWALRSRARTSEGCEVLRGVFVDFLPSEPTDKELEFLPWLDPQRPDHRIIASGLDVARRFARDQVAIVTGDLNMAILSGFGAIRALKLGQQMPGAGS